jgi:acetoin utilization deacetylase AcuC-like enzyme
MITVYSEKHRLQNGRGEFNDGQIMPCFENPNRVDTILARVKSEKLGAIIPPFEFPIECLYSIHTKEYLVFLENAWGQWEKLHGDIDAFPLIWPVRSLRQVCPEHIDGKISFYAMDAGTPITAGTWQAATSSAHVALTAQNLITDGQHSAFALCRPPGHHASKDVYGGYCFLNNAAIAAQGFIDKGAQKVVVLDIDYHHGNGTQDIFYNRDDVMFISIHADPVVEFPYFLGYADEKGESAGYGFNHNFPLPFGSNYLKWLEGLQAALKKVILFEPDAIVISLGVDTFEGDPISEFKLESADYIKIGQHLAQLNIPTLFVMEGGYDVAEIGVNVVNVLSGFEGI